MRSTLLVVGLALFAPPLHAEPPAPGATEPLVIQKPMWCVIVGSQPYSAFGRAKKAADAARTAGQARAAVYDTRDFEDLTWGQLAVVAAAVETEKEASAVVKTMKKQKANAFAKRCTPVAPARPLSDAAGIAPLPKLPTTAYALDPAAFDPSGCFAWSEKHATAACALREHTWQQGGEMVLKFVGAGELPDVELYKTPNIHQPGDMKPTDHASREELSALGKTLKKEGFVPMDLPERKMAPGKTLAFAGYPAKLTWKRTVAGRVDAGTGQWNTYSDVLLCVCPDGTSSPVMKRESENTIDPTGSVTAIPGGRYLVAEWSAHYGIEGDGGDYDDAEVIDIEEVCKKKAPEAGGTTP